MVESSIYIVDLINMKLKELSKDQLNQLIIYMRYRNKGGASFKYGFMTYQSISQIVRRSIEYCRRVCLKHIEDQAAG